VAAGAAAAGAATSTFTSAAGGAAAAGGAVTAALTSAAAAATVVLAAAAVATLTLGCRSRSLADSPPERADMAPEERADSCPPRDVTGASSLAVNTRGAGLETSIFSGMLAVLTLRAVVGAAAAGAATVARNFNLNYTKVIKDDSYHLYLGQQ